MALEGYRSGFPVYFPGTNSTARGRDTRPGWPYAKQRISAFPHRRFIRVAQRQSHFDPPDGKDLAQTHSRICRRPHVVLYRVRASYSRATTTRVTQPKADEIRKIHICMYVPRRKRGAIFTRDLHICGRIYLRVTLEILTILPQSLCETLFYAVRRELKR